MIENEVAKPDGGYGWCILLATCVNLFNFSKALLIYNYKIQHFFFVFCLSSQSI